MKRFLASTAILTIAFTAAASATSPSAPLDRGLVRVEAHAFNERQKIAEPGGHLFTGVVKFDDLSFASLAKAAPPSLSPFASILPVRFSTKLSLKPGVYALGVEIPNSHRFSRTACNVKIDTEDGDEIYSGAEITPRNRKMSEKFTIEEEVDIGLVYEIVCSYDVTGSGSLHELTDSRIVPLIALGDALPRPIAANEVGLEKTSATLNSGARSIGKKGESKTVVIADGMRNGWRVAYRDVYVSPNFGNGTLDQRWKTALDTPALLTVHANGPTMAATQTAETQKRGNLAATHLELNSNLVVTPENAGTTWLALSAIARNSNVGRCFAEATVAGERIENETRHNIRAERIAEVMMRADNKRQLVGAWSLPDLQPGAYAVRVVLACENQHLPIAGSDVTVHLRRPGDENLRPAAPAEFVVEK
jgi:hypothetical protein